MAPELHPRFASALATDADSARAEQRSMERIQQGLGGATPDLLVVFVSHHYGDALEGLGQRLARASGASVVLGCTGESIIGDGREVEREPALALWAAHLPGTQLRPFHVTAEADNDGNVAFSGLPEVSDRERASILMLGEPYSFPMDDYLALLNEELTGVPIVGGMASGGLGPGQNLMLNQSGLLEGGALGVVLEGDMCIDAVVSQGCRPVGQPWVVTACRENVMHKLAGRPALEVLAETIEALPEPDRDPFRKSPFVGLAIDPTKDRFQRGDFLVRRLTGLVRDKAGVAVGDHVRRGMTVQFLLRDADSASEDLTQLLARETESSLSPDPHQTGALLFSCNGRGSRMFDEPDHDVRRVRAALTPEVPVAGFFAMGEIGPVGGRNFLHGFTASVAVFRARQAKEASSGSVRSTSA